MAKSETGMPTKCYVCGTGTTCKHGRPIGRPGMATGVMINYGWECTGRRSIPTGAMTDKEARKVVLPEWPTIYQGVNGVIPDLAYATTAIKDSHRWPDGTAMIHTDGSGKMHGPKVESIDGDVVQRYLSLVPHPSEGALKGRDWKTGRIGE